MSYLSGCQHVSKRGVAEVVETVFGIPVSLGTVAALEREMTEALAVPYAEAAVAVRQAPVKNVDETSWKQAGKRCRLWTAVTAGAVLFLVPTRRGLDGFRALLGRDIIGMVCSDRWGTYNSVPLEQRQVCWAHLKRDFQRCVDRGGAAVRLGEGGLAVIAELFAHWHTFRGGGLDRAALQERVRPVRRQLRALLEAGRGCADREAATFCANLLALEPALWTFVSVEGVEPTNNLAERVQRPAVLWRKNSFGCWSAEGCRFVARLLSVVQTLRLQGRPVVDYLHQVLVATRAGGHAPPLLLTQ
jgi:transposase